MRVELQTICGQLLAAAVNGVYQGIVVAALVGLVLRWLVRTNAATRHAVWFASLVLLVLIMPAHYWLDRDADYRDAMSEGDPPARASASRAETVLPPPSEPTTVPFDLRLTGPAEGSNADPVPGRAPIEESYGPTPGLELGPENRAEFPPGSTSLAGLRAPIAITSSAAGPLKNGPRWAGERYLEPVSWSLQSRLGTPFLAACLLGWLVAAGIRVLLLAMRLRQLRTLTDGSAPAGPQLQGLFHRLRVTGQVSRSVELRVSERQRSAVVLGFFQPVILLPADLAAPPALVEAEHVLNHELAHVRRYDDWANLVQHFIQAVLFFHPAVWWIARQLSLEREIACDDHVLQQGGQRRNYALVLTSVASRINQRPPRLAPGVSNSNSQLQQRITMILNTRRNSSPRLAKARLASMVSATALIAALALYCGPRFVLAQTPAVPPAAAPAASSGSASAGVSAVMSTGEAINPTPAAAISFAEAGSPSAPTPGIEPGPKFKPENPSQDPPEPAEAAPPEAPEAPEADAAPSPHAIPPVARVVKAGTMPQPPRSPDAAGYGDGSIEERLQRLEKMVQSLMAHQNPKRTRESYFKDLNPDLNINQPEPEKLKESADRQAARAAEQAKRAEEQAKRAEEQMKRATKEFENSARAEQEQREQGMFKEAFQKQLEALRKARESLGQEMERLDRQIQKLEKEQQRGDKDQQRRSEAPRERLQAQVLLPEAAAQ